MKINKTIFILLITMFLAIQAFGQTKQQRKNIIKDYDLKTLNALSQQLERAYEREKRAAFEYARQHNLPLVVENEDGHKSYLYRMDRFGNLNYITTSGKADAQTIGTNKLYPGGGLGLALEGEGMKIGIWDAGPVRTTHELLSGKTVQKDQGHGESPDHATHVAGIAAGKQLDSGFGANARGMAYKADIDAYDWNNDFSEMSTAASEGLLVSNHSYGLDLSQVPNVGSYLGAYDDISMTADNLTYYAPYYTVVTAAGNDRNGGYNPSQGGYNLLGGWMTTAKNTIVVAAVDKVLMYMGPSSVHMSNFSSWGPTNNNRVKPDISAQGVDVLSSTAA
ncbi:MAG TPA: S8 family serine peptidase, partial [Flavobacteriaceae bacterium]|nr:S8 family serine peptidase [Flavobacteriaceae bacterium]